MEEESNLLFRNSLYNFLSSRVVYHSLFWICAYILLVILEPGHFGWMDTLINEAINLFFYGVIVYINLFYLIPHFLKKKRYFSFFVLLTAVAIFITPIKMFILHFRFSSNVVLQNELISEKHYFYLANVFIAAGSTLASIIMDWFRHQRERAVLENQNIQSELRFLKSQINPHFLFNTLNSIYALTLKKSDDAPEIVVKLSEMLRYMLYECNEKLVPLEKEVNYVKNYLALEQLRHGGKIDIDFSLEGEVEGLMLAPLLFVPFLENSFKHGASRTINDGYVNVVMRVKDKSQLQFV